MDAFARPEEFQNLFLQGVAEAITRRRKSLRHVPREVVLERGLDEEDGLAFERLNLRLEWDDRSSMAVVVWEDSTVWIWARRLKKKIGVTFRAGFHANVWDVAPKDLVRRIEAGTVAVRSSDKDALRRLWLV